MLNLTLNNTLNWHATTYRYWSISPILNPIINLTQLTKTAKLMLK